MLRRLLLSAAAIATVLVSATAGNAKTMGTLKGVVGPGFSVEVTTAAGKDVKTLKAGTYTIKVQDKAKIHNFRLRGPGLNRATGVPFTGEQTWTVKLKPGKYTYQCDPHAAAGMRGSFRVS